MTIMLIEAICGSTGNTVLAALRTTRRGALPRLARGTLPCRAQDQQNNGSGKVVVNEDVLQRLRAAEEEAAKLREELAAARAQSQVGIVLCSRFIKRLTLLAED